MRIAKRGIGASVRAARPGRSAGPASEQHVVIIGAGFAGLAAAKRLARVAEREAVRITLVDRHNYHTFQPLLYQVATAGLEPHSVGRSVRGVFRRRPVGFRLGAVVDVEWDGKQLVLDDGSRLGFDVLVLAAGASTADYGIEGVGRHAFALKSLPDASRLRNHLLRRFESVDADRPSSDDGGMTFVIAGGGPTGVELAGSIAELLDRVVQVDRPELDTSRARIILVEMLDTVLPPYTAKSQRYTQRALEARGIELRLGTAIEAVMPDRVELSDGESIPTSTVIWTAGVRANPLADVLGLEQTKGGRIAVTSDLRVPGHDDVFVAGDLAGALDEGGEPLPQLAAVAVQQGDHVAKQIVRSRRGEAPESFRYRNKGTMATIGRRDAVAELPLGVRLRGTPARAAWLLLHLVQLAGFRNRVSVLLDWIYNYVTYDRAARLILDQGEPDEHEQLEAARGQQHD